MPNKYKIAVLGIGGVGGFLGGKLAAAYSQSPDIEVVFIARGSNARAIKENGLKLITAEGEMIARPDAVIEDATQLGAIDLLICCTKTYDLENSIIALGAAITPATVVLPILNGVDSTEKLQQLIPTARVLQGCIYLVSKLIEPGIVQQRGEFYSLHFGGDKAFAGDMQTLLGLFQKANINAVLEDNIRSKIWSKFSFISPIATYTSAHNISIGQILESPQHTEALKELMTELLTVASTLSIDLPADTLAKNFQVMEKLPYEATSSMQVDFAGHKSTELETLTGTLISKAASNGVHLPAYIGLYDTLRQR